MCYINDVLIYSSGWQGHLDTLERALEWLRAANLGAKPSKCWMVFHTLEILGHKVNQGTQNACPKLLSQIADNCRSSIKMQV